MYFMRAAGELLKLQSVKQPVKKMDGLFLFLDSQA